jgi:signal transduction histidine kinase
MDIYRKKSRWKTYLATAGIVIVLISLFYTNYITGKLAQEERNKVQLWLTAQDQINRDVPPECLNCLDLTLHQQVLTSNTTIPCILVSETGLINDAINFNGREGDMEFLEKELEQMKTKGIQPVEGNAQLLYFKNSRLLSMLQFFPIVQFVLIGAFILFGYMGFSAARRAEQNRVWVGMAKETAHQLGTPTSAIVGWIEHLRLIREEDAEVQEVLDELQKDVGRLDLIANRFSKIGSSPELGPVDVYDELEKLRAYMERRAPRKVSFDFPGTAQPPLLIYINPPLFDWVVENLLRNALDAMEGKGLIKAEVYHDKDYVYLDISDTGKGIPSNKFKRVFEPGFTTKKRGWGLGLSLAKRIIEDYHEGKIFVKQSEENKGTTFTIQLPKKSPL